MRVLRFLRRILFGLFAVVGAVVVVGTIVMAVLAWRYLPGFEPPAVPDRAVLTLNLADGIVETLPDNPLARASFGDVLTMRDLVQGLDAAGRDDRVTGLTARLGSGGLGLAQAQEIRDAVIAFRGQGKFAVAFAETFGEGGDGNVHYYLATAFDEIWLQPSGDVGLTGVLLESPFAKDALAAIGVAPRLDQRGAYKGAADIFTAAGMSAPLAENRQRLVESWVEQMAAGIAAGRRLEVERVRALIDRGPFAAGEAQAHGLVDRLAYWDEVEAEVEARAGAAAERLTVADYAAATPPPGDAPRIAVVYGLGPVQLAPGGDEPLFGAPFMGSETVAGALREAIEDPGIEAVIFRIDSPGGSYVASDRIWREVQRARDDGKPVIVSMGNVAASGGYFVAAPAHAIVAQPGTVTGSIGVVGGKFVLTDLWDKLGIAWDGVQTGANAALNSPNQDYSEAGWANLQASLDRIYADFTGKVAQGRGLPAEGMDSLALGRVWSGADARANGLVDELGGLSVALRLAREAAGLDPEAAVRLEQFPRPADRFERLLRGLLAGELTDMGSARAVVALARAAERLAPAARLVESLAAPAAGGPLRAPQIYPAE